MKRYLCILFLLFGCFIFRGDYASASISSATAKLTAFRPPSGYIKNDTIYSYVKDYQGNVRSVVRQDGAVVESTDYYPYGTPFTTAGAVQPYKYGTKELDRTASTSTTHKQDGTTH